MAGIEDHGPDPSTLTTAQISRELNNLREIIEARLDGMDKALERAEAFPTEIDKAVKNIRELFDEKFKTVEMRFGERDMRFHQTEEHNRAAIEAAFQSQKEATSKAEAAFTKQIDGQALLLTTVTNALAKEISDVKAAQILSSGQSKGASNLWALIIGGVLFAIGILSFLMPLFRTP